MTARPRAQGWEERLRQRVQADGCANVSDWLARFPGESYVALARRLGAVAIQLERLQLAEAIERRTLPAAARDLLSRTLSASLASGGWGVGVRADFERASACASWASFLTTSLPAEVEPLVSAVWSALRALPPPDGWRPASGDDPLLVAAFVTGWPAGVYDAPPPTPAREVERDEVVADALQWLSARTRALLIEHAGRVVGDLALLRERQIARESGRASWLKPFREDLLIVGSAPNGDAWAIDLRDGEAVGVISHDLVWDREVASARAGMIRVADSLDAALERARVGALPVDFWAARRRRV